MWVWQERVQPLHKVQTPTGYSRVGRIRLQTALNLRLEASRRRLHLFGCANTARLGLIRGLGREADAARVGAVELRPEAGATRPIGE